MFYYSRERCFSSLAQAGQFELNVMLPGMIKDMLESTDMLKNFHQVMQVI
jgi:fumarate hydratase class II